MRTKGSFMKYTKLIIKKGTQGGSLGFNWIEILEAISHPNKKFSYIKCFLVNTESGLEIITSDDLAVSIQDYKLAK